MSEDKFKIMLFYVLLFISVVLSYSFYKYSYDYEKWPNSIGSLFICLIISSFILFTCGMESKWTEIGREKLFCKIFSLKTEKDFSGSFTLGSGGFGSDEKYYFFRQDERGGFYRGKIYTSDSFLFEKDSVPPQIQWDKITYKCPSWIVPWTITRIRNSKYDLIVPVGTVIQKFEVK